MKKLMDSIKFYIRVRQVLREMKKEKKSEKAES